MQTATQLNIVMPNTPGNLAQLTDKLRSADVNINAITCTEGSPNTILHLIVDDPETAKLVLQSLYKVSLSEVLEFTMKNRPGAIANIGRSCAGAGINIHNIYATTCGKEATVYLVVEDAEVALKALMPWKDSFQ